MTERCNCGRPLIDRPGEIGLTCSQCSDKPGFCECPPMTARVATAGRGRHRTLPPPGQFADDPLPEEPWTQLGYANRLVVVYGERLRYVRAWKQWLVWDGKRWAHDETGQAERWAKMTARRMTDFVLASDDPDVRRDCYPIAEKGETNAVVTSVLNLASTNERIAITHGDLDADPFLLNCPNGVLDLRTGDLRPHSPNDLLTKMTLAAYDPEAPGPGFRAFLERVQPDEGMRAFLARLLGHALEGRITEHILPIFWGTGKNGKSTLTTAVVEALGDYADTADRDLLAARSFDAHPTGVADLFGLRLARIDEPDHGRRLAEGTVKQLTGGDRVKARRMREDFWSFDPTHTFLMLTNHRPVITGTDEGIWRRVRLVPWPIVIPEAERDRTLGDRLRLEADAVLAWLVAGYRDWAAHGLGEPDAVTQATANYRDGSDPLGRFLADKCMTHGEIKSSDLFAAWQKWCASEGEESGTNKALSEELENKGFDKKRAATGIFWKGLNLSA
jgi:putative DNA primase/helicase